MQGNEPRNSENDLVVEHYFPGLDVRRVTGTPKRCSAPNIKHSQSEAPHRYNMYRYTMQSVLYCSRELFLMMSGTEFRSITRRKPRDIAATSGHFDAP
jgi:hypothetical protein